MKISTNNIQDFRKSKINKIEEEKNIIPQVELSVGSPNNIIGLELKSYHLDSNIVLNKNNTEIIKNNNYNTQIICKEKISVKNEEKLLLKDMEYSLEYLEELVFNNEETVIKTLPGLIIYLLLKNSNSATEEFLINYISPIIGDLRKPDGSKYKGNPLRVIKSALSSSGIFEKKENRDLIDPKNNKTNDILNNTLKNTITLENEEYVRIIDPEIIRNDSSKFNSPLAFNLWSVKQKEAIQYLGRTIEKFQLKIIEKEKKREEKQQILLGKKTRRMKCSLKKHNIKVHKIYNVLDDLLKNYKKNPELRNILKSPFNNVNTATDLFKKCDNEDICMGILLCFKFFKPFINKVLRKNTEEKKEKNDHLKSLNLKMEEMENKLIDLQKNLRDTCKMESSNLQNLNN